MHVPLTTTRLQTSTGSSERTLSVVVGVPSLVFGLRGLFTGESVVDNQDYG